MFVIKRKDNLINRSGKYIANAFFSKYRIIVKDKDNLKIKSY